MRKSFETTENSLFLTCPSGFMEPPVRKWFGGNSYFYTAVGAFFEWDDTTQYNVVSFLRRRQISEIHFVGNIDNPLYSGLLSDSDIVLRQSWEKQLSQGYADLKSVTNVLLDTKMKTQLLLASHLARQIQRLSESTILGQYITKNAICINAFVYDPDDDSFFHEVEVRRRAEILQGICCN